MCGRFTLTTPAEVLAEVFGLDEVPELQPRYNIAPSQDAPVVGRRGPGAPRRIAVLRWGILRPGAESSRSPLLINARAETLARRPSFREAFARRRCLVPTDGFYEWRGAAGQRDRQPYLVRPADRRPLALAALWEPARVEGEPARFTIITTEPNAVLRSIHDRMPAILDAEAVERWLDPELDDARVLAALLHPTPPEGLEIVRVSRAVNDARFDDPACIAPAEPDAAPPPSR